MEYIIRLRFYRGPCEWDPKPLYVYEYVHDPHVNNCHDSTMARKYAKVFSSIEEAKEYFERVTKHFHYSATSTQIAIMHPVGRKVLEVLANYEDGKRVN